MSAPLDLSDGLHGTGLMDVEFEPIGSEIFRTALAVFGPGNRVIELGRRSRLFVGGTRRAVEVEHRTCTHPTCRVPAELCDIDHVEPWAEGGETTPANGRPRCPQHHPGRHRKVPPQRRRSGGGTRGRSPASDEDGADRHGNDDQDDREKGGVRDEGDDLDHGDGGNSEPGRDRGAR